MDTIHNNQREYFEKANEIILNKGVTVICNNNDFMNLQYFFLLCQKYPQIKRLTIDAENGTNEELLGEIRAKVSAYLFLVNDLKIFEINIRFSSKFQNSKIQNTKKNAFGKILPLMPVNEHSYSFLSSKIGCSCDNFDNFFSEDRFLQNTLESAVYKACKNYLSPSLGTFPKIMEKERKSYFELITFYEKIKGLSVLAFLIFCAFDKTSKSEIYEGYKEKRIKNGPYLKDELSKLHLIPEDEEIYANIINACDMADGMLQLMENVILHAGGDGINGVGFLSFRIHSKNKNKEESVNDRTYLEGQYSKYFAGCDNRFISENDESEETTSNKLLTMIQNNLANPAILAESANENLINQQKIEARKVERGHSSYYLEVRIADISGLNMCEVFQNYLESRVPRKLKEEFKKMTVQTFFSPSKEELESWTKYFKTKENSIHHYGLQLFDSLVACNDGMIIAFSRSYTNNIRSCYSSSGDGLKEDEMKFSFPGTQYAILLPFKKRETQKYSNVNVNINYKISCENGYIVADKENSPFSIRQFLDYLALKREIVSSSQKEKFVQDLCAKLPKYQENVILLFDANDIAYYSVELFCKSISLYISRNKDKETVYIAIRNCNYMHFIEIVRMFAIFYNRIGKSEVLRRTQIYLCGEKPQEEFVLYGDNLNDSIALQSKVAFARGFGSDIEKILEKMLRKRLKQLTEKKESIAFTPFDMYIKNDEGYLIFEQNLLSVLNTDIQTKETGCKICNTHMRIGSKIHLGDFYEAEMLFHNNYYSNRFAYLIKKNIGNLQMTDGYPICFVGYETYSELLLCELRDLYLGKDVDYCVFEHGKEDQSGFIGKNRFRRIEKLEGKVFHIVFVVPVSTTLSTFNKLQADFSYELAKRRDLPGKKITIIDYRYISVIQVRDSIQKRSKKDEGDSFNNRDDPNKLTVAEHKYWELIDTIKKEITSKLLIGEEELQKVHYLSIVETEWFDPLMCKYCFPPVSINERPLIETNKASVIPSQMIGLNDISKSETDNNSTFKRNCEISCSDISTLKSSLLFGHYERNKNHFKYYFQSEKYYLDNGDKIRTWLVENIRERVGILNSQRLHYDIIVSPLHFSNTEFVVAVNDLVFGGASQVLNFEVEKEYKDNFVAKNYSLRILYDNLVSAKQDAVINFHYVDDAIIQGNNILRTNTLLHSLFPSIAFDQSNEDGVKVNVFKSIIIMFNRLSSNSITNYIGDISNYYFYIDIKISSIRMHGNACFLCNEANDERDLSKYSATNAMSEFWAQRSSRHQAKRIDGIEPKVELSNGDREYRRLYCDHNLNKELGLLKDCKNDALSVLITFTNILRNSLTNDADGFEMFLSYIVSFSTPFLSLRKSNKEIALFIINYLLFLILSQKTNPTESEITAALNDICLRSIESSSKVNTCVDNLKVIENKVREKIENKEKHEDQIQNENRRNAEDLLKVLIKCSVELKSNFIIRNLNITNILVFANNNSFLFSRSISREKKTQCDSIEFVEYLEAYIKKLISLSSDGTKATRLEYLILFGKEYHKKSDIEEKNDIDEKNEIEEGKPFWDFTNYFTIYINKRKKKNIKKLINSFRKKMFIENTKVIYTAISDIAKGNDITKDEAYYFENYRRISDWNNEKIESVSSKLANIYMKLVSTKNQDSNLQFKSHSIEQYYNNVSIAIRALFDNEAEVEFVCDRKIDQLCIDESTGLVNYVNETVFSSFASSRENSNNHHKCIIDEVVEQVIGLKGLNSNLNKNSYFITPKYEICEQLDKSFYISAIIMLRNYRAKPNETQEEIIYLAIKWKIEEPVHKEAKGDDLRFERYVRYILLFRNKLLKRIEKDLNSNLLSNLLSRISTQNELEKARASYHANEGDSFNKENPENYAGALFFGSKEPEHYMQEYSEYSTKQAILSMLINTRIGRANIKVLTKQHFEETVHAVSMKNDIMSFVELPYANTTNLYDREGHLVHKDEYSEYFTKVFFEKNYRKTKSGKYPSRKYINAFVFELIKSAIKYMRKCQDGESNQKGIEFIVIHSDSDYLWVENVIDDNFLMETVSRGIRRKGDGISLATICEFFCQNFNDVKKARVKIVKERRKIDEVDHMLLCVGLPIFLDKEASDES